LIELADDFLDFVQVKIVEGAEAEFKKGLDYGVFGEV
jgi:hypothetical protein